MEADNEKEAKEKAKEATEIEKIESTYGSILDLDKWEVEEVK